jgi:hypothetical protein
MIKYYLDQLRLSDTLAQLAVFEKGEGFEFKVILNRWEGKLYYLSLVKISPVKISQFVQCLWR